jgi:predicted SAM-dependent methyltransferase
MFFFAPAKELLNRFSTHHISASELAEQVDTVMRTVCALQKSIKNELLAGEHNLRSLRADMQAVGDRIEFVRMELFESMQVNKPDLALQDMQQNILNQEKYDAFCKSGCMRINIGCGHKPLPDYLNVDLRNLPGVDIVGHAAKLPFARGSLVEIFSAHLFEHFTLLELEKNILPHWHDLLAEGGRMRAVVPDAESMIMAYVNGEMSFADLREVTFGAQDYNSDYHQTMFTADSLRHLLQQAGFKNIEMMVTNRPNGKCREMEVVVEK